MSWQYVAIYALMFVTSPPFIVAAGLAGAIGLLVGWRLGRRGGWIDGYAEGRREGLRTARRAHEVPPL